jgi:hypothetical protein
MLDQMRIKRFISAQHFSLRRQSEFDSVCEGRSNFSIAHLQKSKLIFSQIFSHFYGSKMGIFIAESCSCLLDEF